MLTGNKGEWSEIYVFLKLLADGRLNAADANLNAIPNVYYPIIKILRQENTISREYRINGNIKIVDGNNNELLNLPIAEFVSRSQQLFNELRNAENQLKALLMIPDSDQIRVVQEMNDDHEVLAVIEQGKNNAFLCKKSFVQKKIHSSQE